MPKAATATPDCKPQVRRDIRVDRLGLVDELVSQYRKPLADQVKSSLEAGERVEGDLFGALLVGSTVTDLDADKFVAVWEAGKMTRAQFVSAIKVSASRAREILSERDLAKVIDEKTGPVSLRVTRLKGVQVELVDALKRLSADVLSAPKPGTAV